MGCRSPIRSLLYVCPSLFLHSFDIKCYSSWFRSSNSSKTGLGAITYNPVTSESTILQPVILEQLTRWENSSFRFPLALILWMLKSSARRHIRIVWRDHRPRGRHFELRTFTIHIVAALPSFAYFYIHSRRNHQCCPITRTLFREKIVEFLYQTIAKYPRSEYTFKNVGTPDIGYRPR
jgi:hypothetical protein